MPSPVDVFEAMRERALTMTQTAFIESGRAWPDDQGTVDFIKTMLGIGIAAASEHYAANPEHLAIAGSPICTQCREPVQSLQVGTLYNNGLPEDGETHKVAWPCGHAQEL